jgi:glucose-6-phosphate-specific signal transduction histidine kinase
MQRRWYWKLYLLLGTLFSVLLVTLVFWFFLRFPEEASAPAVLLVCAGFPFYIVQLAGLYGFVYWRRVGSERLWRLVFAVTAIETALNLHSLIDSVYDLGGGETALFLIVSLTGTALVVPLFLALFIYAFRSPRLWAEVNLA